MLTKYKECIYRCGKNYIDMIVYPAFAIHKGKRRTKFRPTSEVQKKLNDIHREQKLERLIKTNFNRHSKKVELTYDEEHLPENEEQAFKDIRNFIRKVRRRLKKKGLPALKYIFVAEKEGKRSIRFHHHLVIDCELSDEELDEIWDKGFTNFSPLKTEVKCIEKLAKYMLKYASSIPGSTYHPSRNLINPKGKPRYSKLSRNKIEFMFNFDDESNLENLFPEYVLYKEKDKPRISYNKENGGYYFECKYYKPPNNHNKQRNRKRE